MKIGISACLFLAPLIFLNAQTNPTPQTLPYTQDFTSLAWTSTSYPDGIQGWVVTTSPSSSFSTSPPINNRALIGSSNAGTTSGSLHNYNGKVGLLDTNSLDLALAFSINTIGFSDIQLSYSIMTIRNPYNYLSNNRINEVIMQYRIGVSSDFTNLAGTEYQNNTAQKITGSPTPENLQSKSIALPAVCNDQAVVQLRLISRWVSGSGTMYPSFAIDDISVTGEELLPVELSSFTVMLDNQNHARLTWVTQSETGVAGFYILRGQENNLAAAEQISPLIPATNTSQQQTYSFTDADPSLDGVYCYWLQSADLDGSVEFHGPVELSSNPSGSGTSPPLPLQTGLSNPYPNPFNPRLYIPFELATAANVSFQIYNPRGQTVRRFDLGTKGAGPHRVEWDGRDDRGQALSSGVYQIRMLTGRESFQRRVVMLQ